MPLDEASVYTEEWECKEQVPGRHSSGPSIISGSESLDSVIMTDISTQPLPRRLLDQRYAKVKFVMQHHKCAGGLATEQTDKTLDFCLAPLNWQDKLHKDLKAVLWEIGSCRVHWHLPGHELKESQIWHLMVDKETETRNCISFRSADTWLVEVLYSNQALGYV